MENNITDMLIYADFRLGSACVHLKSKTASPYHLEVTGEERTMSLDSCPQTIQVSSNISSNIIRIKREAHSSAVYSLVGFFQNDHQKLKGDQGVSLDSCPQTVQVSSNISSNI